MTPAPSRGHAPVIGVLAVQGDVREHLAALRAVGATASGVRRPSELDRVDGLVIPGVEPLRERLRAGMPAFGSCAGMIMLADRIEGGRSDQQTLGGLDITVRRNAFGRQVDSFEEDLAVVGLDEPVRAVFIRAPWVAEVGPGVEVLAEVVRGSERHPVAVRQGALLATSFHPEVTGDHRLHRLFVELASG